MLLPSILQILSGDHVQTKVVKSVESGFKAEITAAVEELSGSEGNESENGGKAGFLKPVELRASFPERLPSGQSLEELLRTIHKFQKPNPKRVVDVFE